VTRDLEPLLLGDGVLPTEGGGEGLCLYDGGREGLFAVVVVRSGVVRQFRLTVAADGTGSAALVRQFEVGSESEGCVVDDAEHALYLAQEDVGLWRYGADPGDGDHRRLVDGVLDRGGHQTGDIEGVTLADTGGGGGVVITSSQAPAGTPSYFSLFDRRTGAYRGSFRVTSGDRADGCSHTDGIAVTTADLGSAFPSGVFVCQDDHNTAPGSAGDQDFKLSSTDDVLATSSATTSLRR
jgi:3-phytase